MVDKFRPPVQAGGLKVRNAVELSKDIWSLKGEKHSIQYNMENPRPSPLTL